MGKGKVTTDGKGNRRDGKGVKVCMERKGKEGAVTEGKEKTVRNGMS